MRVGRWAGVAVAWALQCSLPPYGQAILVVDTDLPVPSVINRLRVDVYTNDGAWIDSRDFSLSNPSDWPASFGVAADDSNDKDVLVRLRAYSDDSVRQYGGERWEPTPVFTPLVAPQSLAELCESAARLDVGGTIMLRRGRSEFLPPFKTGQCEQLGLLNNVGASGAYVDIEKPGTYCFGAIATYPRVSVEPSRPPYAQVTLQLRSTCDDPTTAIACDGGIISVANAVYEPPSIRADLQPGRYYVLMSGAMAAFSPTDVLVAASEGECGTLPAPPASVPVSKTGWPARLRGKPTPDVEPEPSMTVERLVRVRVREGAPRRIGVTLTGACAGRMAKLGDGRADPNTAATCVDGAHLLEKVGEGALAPEKSARGTFARGVDCVDDPDRDLVCVRGRAFVFGSKLGSGIVVSAPPRIAAVRSFLMDRHEVTIARLRAAFAQGLVLDRPTRDLGDGSRGPYCFWSATPGTHENHAVACISWYGARAMCRFVGGDLPTEAQWEFAATVFGSRGDDPFKRDFPWGSDPPRCSCADASGTCHAPVYGRYDDALPQIMEDCPGRGAGPLPVDAADDEMGDVTPGGIAALGGGLSELVLDSVPDQSSSCWRAASVIDPVCWEDDAPARGVRGGFYSGGPANLLPTIRDFTLPSDHSPHIGFRCVYEVP